MMKIIENELNIDPYFPKYASEGTVIAFLDIETDGLSHLYNKIVLIGLNIVSNNDAKIIQLFSDKGTKKDEAEILNRLIFLLKEIDIIYTFNGSTFDIPFITKKLKQYKIYNIFEKKTHIDLIKVIRKNRKKLGLENCKLKTVEKHIGIDRKDEISGKESVMLYKEYLKTKAPALEKTILQHNFDDIYYLPDILKLEDSLRDSSNEIIPVEQMDLFSTNPEISFSSASNEEINPEELCSEYSEDVVSNKKYSANKCARKNMFFEIVSIKAKKNSIDIKGNIISETSEYKIFGNSYSMNIDSENRKFEFSVMTEKCYLGENIKAKYLNLDYDDLMNYNLVKTKDDCGARLPKNILLLEKEDEILTENIKKLIQHIMSL